MHLYNTLTKKEEEFIPYNKDIVTMYTCGPTVYNFAHIGNLRTYISEDILEKSLNYLGYKVKRCMNITDVGHLVSDADTGDDKMQVAAKREHKSALEIAEFYTNAFFNDLEKLNIKKPDIISKATDSINNFIEMITKLLDTGYAYIAGGNIYFDTSKMPNYFDLSGRNLEEQLEAVREDVEVDDNKRNKSDFVLWFTKSKFDDQELKWSSPWGEGYPGWHIECSSISINNLGNNLDLHCGGIDLVFPHHTNEIAQSEAYLGHKWCNYWVHMEYLNDKSGKMSKSKGDFLTLQVLIDKGYNPLSYRFMCLNSHYRKQLVFSYESLDQAENAYNKLLNKIKSIKKDDSSINNDEYNKYNELFKNALSDNLNTANAITIIYDLLKSDVNNNTKLVLISEFDKVLSLNLITEQIVNNDDTKILEQIALRNEAKKNKDFQLADQIRDDLLKNNIRIIDTREGTTYEIIKGE